MFLSSSGRRVITSSPSVTFASPSTTLLKLDTDLCTSLNCATSPMVTDALALSTAMNDLNASASLCLLLSVRPFTTTPNLLLFIRYLTRFNALIVLSHSPSGAPYAGINYLLIYCVANQQCEQTIWHSPVIQLAARSTNHSCFSCFVFSMVGGHTPQECSIGEQLTMLTDTSERDGSSPFFFSYHMPAEIRALPHDTFGVDVSHIHVFQHLAPKCTNTILPKMITDVKRQLIQKTFRKFFKQN